jgi:predicted transcriptional regulator
MPRKSSVLSISLPPDLASNLDSAARKEHRSRWRSLREKAALKAVEQGLKEKDIERLVDEERSARRR